jgi:hypothetical protein
MSPTIEQRLQTLSSNLEAAIKTESPNAPHLMLMHQLKELADIVRELRRSPAPGQGLSDGAGK